MPSNFFYEYGVIADFLNKKEICIFTRETLWTHANLQMKLIIQNNNILW